MNAAWCIGAVMGFTSWLIVWNLVGSGKGELSLLIKTITCGGWIMWCLGIHKAYAASPKQRRLGLTLAATTLVTWLALVGFKANGIGVIKVSLLCISIQSVLIMAEWISRRAWKARDVQRQSQ